MPDKPDQSSQPPVSMHRAVSIEFLENTQAYSVKVPRGQKDPGKGWDPKNNTADKSRLTLHEIKADPECNLGVHLHGDTVDVDIDSDSPHLMAALDTFLPPCAHVWGRKSRPRTHRVYALRSSDFDPSLFPVLRRLQRIPEAAMELRGGHQSRGEYSLLPGSVHPSGEMYEWSDLGRARNSVSVTEPDLIVRAFRMAGAIAVISPYWVEGVRNDLIMALSGFMHRSWTIAQGMGDDAFALSKEEAERFIEVLLVVAGDDPSDKQARMKTFHATWKKAEKGHPVTGATRIAELTADTGIVQKLYTLLMDNPEMAVVESFISRFAIWQGPGLCIDMDLAAKGHPKPMMARQQFTNSFGHVFISIADPSKASGVRRRLLADLMYSMPSTLRLAGLTFEPGGDKMIETREGPKINQWSGFEIPPYKGNVSDEDVGLFLRYVKEILADNDPKINEWVLDWIAHIVAAPARKSGTALVLVGKPGAGKSVLGHGILTRIIGSAHSAVTNTTEAITKSFNAIFDNKIFVQCDEATSNRQKIGAAKMKSLITDPTIMIEPKGVDAYVKPNHARFLFTSNDVDDAIHISDGLADRRYTVLQVSSAKANDVLYWSTFWKWLDEPDTLAKIHRWLLQREIDWKRVIRPAATQAKINMQQRSMDLFDSWLAAMLARGHPLSERNHNHPFDAFTDKRYMGRVHLRDEWPLWLTYGTLAEDYRDFCARSGVRSYDTLNEQQVIIALRDRGLLPPSEQMEHVRKKFKDFDDRKNATIEKRIYCRTAPTQDAIAKYLNERYGIVIDELRDDEDDELPQGTDGGSNERPAGDDHVHAPSTGQEYGSDDIDNAEF